MQHLPSTPGGLAASPAAIAALFAAPLPSAEQRASRRLLAAHIERCIAILDSLDGDPDLEEEPDREPYLAGTYCNAYGGDDREADDSDDEHSLGSLGGTAEGCTSRRLPAWSGGFNSDRELDECDREDGGDDELAGDEHEPSLGSLDKVASQERWSDDNTDIVDGERDILDPPERSSFRDWREGRADRMQALALVRQAERIRGVVPGDGIGTTFVLRLVPGHGRVHASSAVRP